jgi:hypothetical protein
MYYIRSGETSHNVSVSIDGAHVKTQNDIHFDVIGFMHDNGYAKCNGDDCRWQGEYQNENYSSHICISSKPGIGDVCIVLNNGQTLYIESKKFKSGSGGEYPAMREAIGQLMTGCPDDESVLPIVAVPYNNKSEELANKWSQNKRISTSGIRFLLVKENGNIDLV